MADVEKILRLVSEGVLTPEEADEILSATTSPRFKPIPAGRRDGQCRRRHQLEVEQPRHLRIEVTEGGKRVVNLRVPMNMAGWASTFLPGLSDEQTDRIRGAMASGQRGPICRYHR